MSCPIDRFVLKTRKDPSGCVLWVGGRLRGYGSFNLGGRTVAAHRQSYVFFVGPIPDGLFVLHKCDRRLCVSPTCLFLGTGQDNMDDMKRKGRQSRPAGELHPRHKINEATVRSVRVAVAGGESQASVARRLGLDRSTISRVVTGDTWPHIT